MAWWAWALVGWLAMSALVALFIGRAFSVLGTKVADWEYGIEVGCYLGADEVRVAESMQARTSA